MATVKSIPISLEDDLKVIDPDEIDRREKTYLLLRLFPEFDRAIEELMERMQSRMASESASSRMTRNSRSN